MFREVAGNHLIYIGSKLCCKSF